ncbi:polymerase/histidinol phosphatase-like protein [Geopyxis carbonaria]|nr:polymerase/histidinol phosphatase-like protein [Geopyxis carbonaria]
MPFSHHSHSGQYCLHATNLLEEMIQTAIAKGMRVLSLTEHIPRDQREDLYPEEVEAQCTTFDLFRNFANYYDQALRLRARYSSHIHLLIGFEAEYIRPSSIALIRNLQDLYKFDFFIGSVHHVNSIPIDYNHEMYKQAMMTCGGTEELLFEAYLDDQYEMLKALRPAVVGHFDLIRLKSADPARRMSEYGNGVWQKVLRNLTFISSYKGILELNSAAVRKGMHTPYPERDICKVFMELGGRFTLSDDSHGVEQIGQNYYRVLEYIHEIGLGEIHYLEKLPMGEIATNVLDACAVRTMSVEDLKKEVFWQLVGGP